MADGTARPAGSGRAPSRASRAALARKPWCCSAPDGYTLFLFGPNNAINATFYSNLSFDVEQGHAARRRVGDHAERDGGASVGVPAKMVGRSSSPTPRPTRARSTTRSAGWASRVYVSGELFKQMTGVEMQHVTYRGAGPGDDRLAGRRPGACHVRQPQLKHPQPHQGKPAACPRRHLGRSASPGAAGRADSRPTPRRVSRRGGVLRHQRATHIFPPAVLAKLNSEYTKTRA